MCKEVHGPECVSLGYPPSPRIKTELSDLAAGGMVAQGASSMPGREPVRWRGGGELGCTPSVMIGDAGV